MIISFAKDWNDVPTCVTHLMRGMAREQPVLWIESIGTRSPRWGSGRDWRRVLRRLRLAAAGPQWKETNLWVWSPLMIPGARGRWSRTVNRWLLQWTIKRWERRVGEQEMRDHGDVAAGKPWSLNGEGGHALSSAATKNEEVAAAAEYWCFVPNAVDYLAAGARVVYYCVDDWTQFENLDGAWLGACEQRLLKRADSVFAVSPDLVEKCREIAGERVTFMPHGVDYDLFRRALDPATVLPSELTGVARPVIGFYGNISPWIDFKLIRRLAEARPGWTFVMVGPVNVDLEEVFGVDDHGLPKAPFVCRDSAANCTRAAAATRTGVPSNILFPGRREHAGLAAWCKAFDAAIIPYDLDHPRMKSVNPVKARELLAAGVPLVSCDIEAMHGFGDDVLIAGRDAQSWLDALERQVKRTDRDAISQRRAGDDWARRIEEIGRKS